MTSNHRLMGVVLCGGVAASIWNPSTAAAQSREAAPALLQPSEQPEGIGVPPPGFVAPSADPDVTRDTTYDPGRSGVTGTSMRGRAAGFFAYNFGIPVGGVRDFTANVSPIGVDLQFRGWLTDAVSLGLSGGWSSYVDERPRTTITMDNAAITASLYNQMQLTTGRFLVHYQFSGGAIKPYIAPHVGLGWAWFESEAADLAVSDSEFSFILGGELGAIFGDDPMVLANVRYSWMPGVDFLNTVGNVQTLSLQLGVGI